MLLKLKLIAALLWATLLKVADPAAPGSGVGASLRAMLFLMVIAGAAYAGT